MHNLYFFHEQKLSDGMLCYVLIRGWDMNGSKSFFFDDSFLVRIT